jgi:hypothetical protein
MTNINTKLVGRIAVAAALSLGLAASAVAVASASPDGHHSSRHFFGRTSWQTNRVEGTVSTYVAGTSISILSKGSTTPVSYTLTTGTTITGLGTGDTLVSPDRVVLELSTTTPVTVTAIKVVGHCFKGLGFGHSHGHGFNHVGFGGQNSMKNGNFRR